MIAVPEILNQEISGMKLINIILFFIIILFTYIIRAVVLYIITNKLAVLAQKTKNQLDDMFLDAVKTPLSYFILLHGFYLALMALQLNLIVPNIDIIKIVNNVYLLAGSFIILYFIFKLIDIVAFYLYKSAKKTSSTLDDQIVPLIIKSLRILVIILGLLFILQNFGYNITTLLAGLGLGGLAFALAAQDTVSNLFGSITIFSDKPFQLGDWIEIADFEGTVEEIGFRSTRIRRFDQALVTIPNSQFIKSGVINHSAMNRRRIKFELGVTYATTPNQMRNVIDGIKKIIEEDDRFDKSYYIVKFTDFGAYSLNIFIYCFTKTTVWIETLGVREEFNLKIMEMLDKMGVEIAFPSQTIYLNQNKDT